MSIVMQLPGPKGATWLERDAAVISPSYTRSYPFVMDHGSGTEVWDVDGNRFLDFSAGIAVVSTGHSHPAVVKAIQEQAARFIHMSGTDFYYAQQITLAERLNELAPGEEPKQVFFTNSGTESVEAALKLARYVTGRPRFLAFIGGFHGRTMGALSLTGSKAVHKRGFMPLVPGITHVPYAYCYRCPLNLEYPACDIACVKYIEDTVFKHYVPADEVAAIFVEPIQGEGGYVVPPPEFHPRLKALCEKHGILFVADEVQSGIGRTGKMFAMEHWDVVPDMICLAKGIASGMPLGVMVARRSLMTWPPGAHANTFGGNPISCAAALTTLALVQHQFASNAASVGALMLAKLRSMQEQHPTMGDVRGKGLMIGVELVEDKATKERAPELRNEVVQGCYKRGLLVLGCGANTLRFMPPLNTPVDMADEALSIFEEA
ncbi:MAG: acetyl ornithine aminotransferase family protein, partial [Chloroflexota bacterium]